MHIGILIFELTNGGNSYQIVRVAKALQKKHNSVTIYTLNNTLQKLEPKLVEDLTIKSVDFDPKSIQKFFYPFYVLKSLLALIVLLSNDSKNLDILNPHDWIVHWVCVFIKLKTRLNVVWLCNDVWFIPEHRLKEKSNMLNRIVKKYVLGYIDRFLTKWVDRIIVLDKRIEKIISSYYMRPTILIRSGIDLATIEKLPSKNNARMQLQIEQNVFMFLCLAIFLPHRRFEDAILAFKKLLAKTTLSVNYALRLFIVGSDLQDKHYANSIKMLIKKEGLSDLVHMHISYLPTYELLLYLKSCDVYIFPNEKQTWGLTVIEAMALGTPCIVSSGAGVHEVVQERQNGLLFPVRNVEVLSEKMALLYRDVVLRKYISKNAQLFVAKSFSWDKFADRILAIFSEVKNQKKRYRKSFT